MPVTGEVKIPVLPSLYPRQYTSLTSSYIWLNTLAQTTLAQNWLRSYPEFLYKIFQTITISKFYDVTAFLNNILIYELLFIFIF